MLTSNTKLCLTTVTLGVFLILNGSAQLKQPRIDELLPEGGFDNYAQLKTWASNSSSGSGGANITKIKGSDVFYSIRSFSSGLSVSELVFFYETKNGRLYPFLILPKQLKEYRVTSKDDKIAVESFNVKNKTWVKLLEFEENLIP